LEVIEKMGYSWSVEADQTMEKIFAMHNDEGLLVYDGEKYFCEPSSKEYKDGRIVVSVHKICGVAFDGRLWGRRVGSFTIKPDGSIAKRALSKFPFLKAVQF